MGTATESEDTPDGNDLMLPGVRKTTEKIIPPGTPKQMIYDPTEVWVHIGDGDALPETYKINRSIEESTRSRIEAWINGSITGHSHVSPNTGDGSIDRSIQGRP